MHLGKLCIFKHLITIAEDHSQHDRHRQRKWGGGGEPGGGAQKRKITQQRTFQYLPLFPDFI